jgi:hypothetical protein
MKIMPLAVSSPATRNDLCFHDTTNAAVARATAIIGTTGPNHAASTGASPARTTSDANSGTTNNSTPCKKGRTTTSVAAVSPTANTCFEFVMAQKLQLDLF